MTALRPGLVARLARGASELLSSMRFAISVLTVIAIASIIGTVFKQNETPIAYVDKFGPFWARVFDALGLPAIYGATWFYGLLAFLITSVSLCIARNAPKFFREARDWRAELEERSLQSFHLRLQLESDRAPAALADACAAILSRHGFRLKRRDRPNGLQIAAKTGSASRYGYIATHTAIVVLAIGYLLDTNLPIRFQMLALGKTPVSGSLSIADVPPSGRLGTGNFSFRGSLAVPEGQQSDYAVVNVRDSVFVQELPFTLSLKRFIVEYYPTGMPRMFRSEVTLRERSTGETIDAGIEVNKPLIHDGIAIYQASFDDGGSGLELSVLPFTGSSDAKVAMTAAVGDTAPVPAVAGVDVDGYRIEFTTLRVINVENIGAADSAPRPAGDNVAAVVAPSRGERNKTLRNVGPSFGYRLRGPDGVAREFTSYVAPIQLDGRLWYLIGVRDSIGAAFRYLRMPADSTGTLDRFLRLRAALQDPARRAEAARHYADRSLSSEQSPLRPSFEGSASRTLDLFATGGFQAVATFLDRAVPEPEREKAAQVFLRILGGTMHELDADAQAAAGVPPGTDEEWLQAATNALSDSFLVGSPVILRLDNFRQVQASVFQLTRAPGKSIVYLGCLMLVAGVFSMFYLRERRVWIWLARDRDTDPTRLSMAMSGARRSIDLDREFEVLRAEIGAMASEG